MDLMNWTSDNLSPEPYLRANGDTSNDTAGIPPGIKEFTSPNSSVVISPENNLET